jgi:hypothetical protein
VDGPRSLRQLIAQLHPHGERQARPVNRAPNGVEVQSCPIWRNQLCGD